MHRWMDGRIEEREVCLAAVPLGCLLSGIYIYMECDIPAPGKFSPVLPSLSPSLRQSPWGSYQSATPQMPITQSSRRAVLKHYAHS